MNKKNLLLPPVALFILLVAGITDAAAMDVLEEIKKCAHTEDRVMRSECYESLGKQVLADEFTESTSTVGATPADQGDSGENAVGGLPEDLGGSTFSKKTGNDKQEVRGLVTSCLQGADRKWFFIFEKGQIWKQVSDERLRYGECNFEVTIVKDFFGYKMRIDGERRNIRIRRHR